VTDSASASLSSTNLLGSIVRVSTLYSVALLAQRMASLILLPVNTRHLSPADFGVLELLEQVAVVVSLLLGGSYAASLGYFYFEDEGEENRRRVIGTTVIGSAILGSLAGIVGLLFAPIASQAAFRSPDFAPYIRMTLISLPFAFVLEAEFSALRVQNRAVAFAVGSVLRVVLTIAATIILVAIMNLRIWGVLFSTFSVFVISTVTLAIYLFRGSRPVFDLKLALRMWRFAVPLGLSGIWMFIIHFGDRFILPHYRPLSDLGIYGLAYKLAMVISLVYGSFHAYWGSQIYVVMKRDDAHEVLARVFTYVITALSFCALVLVVASRPALRIMTPPAFHGAASLVPLLVGAYLVRAIGDFFRVLFFAANKPSGDAICNGVGAAVCLSLYFTLIPKYGIWGAGFATTITFVVIGVMSAIWVHKLYPYRMETLRLSKVGLVLTVLLGLYFTVPVSTLWFQIGWAALLAAAYPVILVLLKFPTAGERGRLLSVIRPFLPAASVFSWV
jgi:O-antigen/teichoic acid export membrane protein